MQDCVSSTLAQPARGSDPPEKRTKSKERRPSNQHAYDIDFPPKKLICLTHGSKKVPPDHLPSSPSQNPSIQKLTHSNRIPRSAFRHTILEPHVSFLLLPWSPKVPQGAKIASHRGTKMETPSLPNDCVGHQNRLPFRFGT